MAEQRIECDADAIGERGTFLRCVPCESDILEHEKNKKKTRWNFQSQKRSFRFRVGGRFFFFFDSFSIPIAMTIITMIVIITITKTTTMITIVPIVSRPARPCRTEPQPKRKKKQQQPKTKKKTGDYCFPKSSWPSSARRKTKKKRKRVVFFFFSFFNNNSGTKLCAGRKRQREELRESRNEKNEAIDFSSLRLFKKKEPIHKKEPKKNERIRFMMQTADGGRAANHRRPAVGRASPPCPPPHPPVANE